MPHGPSRNLGFFDLAFSFQAKRCEIYGLRDIRLSLQIAL
jgi:hypothetical protein